LALLGDLKIVRPELKPIKKLKLKLTTKSQIEKRPARTKDDSEQKVEANNVLPQ
jgi:hypothetical protein